MLNVIFIHAEASSLGISPETSSLPMTADEYTVQGAQPMPNQSNNLESVPDFRTPLFGNPIPIYFPPERPDSVLKTFTVDEEYDLTPIGINPGYRLRPYPPARSEVMADYLSRNLSTVYSSVSLDKHQIWDLDHELMIQRLTPMEVQIRSDISKGISDLLDVDVRSAKEFVDLTIVIGLNLPRSYVTNGDDKSAYMIDSKVLEYFDLLSEDDLDKVFDVIRPMTSLQVTPTRGFLAPTEAVAENTRFSFANLVQDMTSDFEAEFGATFRSYSRHYYPVADEVIQCAIVVDQLVKDIEAVFEKTYPPKLAISLMNAIASVHIRTAQDASIGTIWDLAAHSFDQTKRTDILMQDFLNIYNDLWSTDDAYVFWIAAKLVNNKARAPIDAAIRSVIQLDLPEKVKVFEDRAADQFLDLSYFGNDVDDDTMPLLEAALTLTELMQLTVAWVDDYRETLNIRDPNYSLRDVLFLAQMASGDNHHHPFAGTEIVDRALKQEAEGRALVVEGEELISNGVFVSEEGHGQGDQSKVAEGEAMISEGQEKVKMGRGAINEARTMLDEADLIAVRIGSILRRAELIFIDADHAMKLGKRNNDEEHIEKSETLHDQAEELLNQANLLLQHSGLISGAVSSSTEVIQAEPST